MKIARKLSVSAAAASTVALMFATSGTAKAGDTEWVGLDPFSTKFTDSLNWQFVSAPGSGDRAIFSSVVPNDDPSFDSGTVVINQLLIGPDSAGSNGNYWTFYGTAGGAKLQVNSDVTLADAFSAGAQLYVSGMTFSTPTTFIGTHTGIEVGNFSSYISSSTTLAGNGTFQIDSGSLIRGFISQGSSDRADVYGTADTTGFNINGGGYIADKSTGNVIIGGNSTVSNGTFYIDPGAQLSMTNGSVLNVNGSNGYLQVTGSYALPNNTKLNVSNGGHVYAASYLDLGNSNTGSLSVDGANSTYSAQNLSDWGLGSAGAATVSLSTNSQTTLSQLRLGSSGGSAYVQVLSGAQLTTSSSLLMGSAGSHGTLSLNVNGGYLNNQGTSFFDNGSKLNLFGGSISFGGDGTLATGSTFAWSGGAVNIASGHSLNVSGGVVNNTSGGQALSNGGTIRVINAGQFSNNSYFDIANGAAAGTLLVDGAGSKFTSLSSTSDWGNLAGNNANVTFSNAGAGTYNAVRMSFSGGSSTLNLQSGGNFNTTLFQAGNGTGATPLARINIAGGSFNDSGVGTFLGGADVALSSGIFSLGGDTTFSTGSNLNWTGGNLAIASGKTLTFSGGTGSFSVGTGLSNGATIHVTNGGQVVNSAYLDIGSTFDGGANGTLTIDGAGSKYSSTGAYIDLGLNTGNFGTMSIANNGAGTFSGGLHLAGGGGKALLSMSGGSLNVSGLAVANSSVAGSVATISLSNGTVNANGLTTGSSAAADSAVINITGGGVLNSTGQASFLNGTSVAINSGGVLAIGGNSTFSTGSSLNFNPLVGTVSIASGAKLDFDGGVGTFNGAYKLGNGATLAVTNGGQAAFNTEIDVANGASTGTLLVDGTNSKLNSNSPIFRSNWGVNSGNSATVTFSNSAVGSFTPGILMSTNGGSTNFSILSGATVTAGDFTAGGGSTGSSSVNVNNANLTISNDASFGNHTTVNLTGTGVMALGGNATFSTGSTLNALPFAAVSLSPNKTLAFDGGVGTISGVFNGLQQGEAVRVTNGGQFTTTSGLPVALVGGGASLLVDGTNSKYIDQASNESWANAGPATVTFSNGGAGTISGNLQIAYANSGTVNVVNGGLLQVGSIDTSIGGGNATINVNGGTLRTTGNLNLFGGETSGGTINYSAGTVSIGGTLGVGFNGTGQVLLTTGGNKVLKVGGLEVDPTGKIDLSDNDMIVGNLTSFGTIQGLVKTARNGGTWITSTGLTSTAAATNVNHSTSLGVITGAEYHSIGAASTLFDGYTVNDTDTLVKYTWNGDADFSGKIDANDYGRIDSGYQNQHNAGFVFDWFHGDFDYNGDINANDYALIDSAYQLQSGTLRAALDYLGTGVLPTGKPSASLQEVINHEAEFGAAYTNDFIFNNVPEPGCMCLSMVALAMLTHRRRKTRQDEPAHIETGNWHSGNTGVC